MSILKNREHRQWVSLQVGEMQSKVLASVGVAELVLVFPACTCPGFFLVPGTQAQALSSSLPPPQHPPFKPPLKEKIPQWSRKPPAGA